MFKKSNLILGMPKLFVIDQLFTEPCPKRFDISKMKLHFQTLFVCSRVRIRCEPWGSLSSLCLTIITIFAELPLYFQSVTLKLKLFGVLLSIGVVVSLWDHPSKTRTTDALLGNCLHSTAKNQLLLPNFQVRPEHILSATLAQIFRFLPSMGVRSL